MRAQIIQQYGDPSAFQFAEVEMPKAADHEVVVRLAATSVNPIDCKTRLGVGPQHKLPAVLGCDVAGVVTEVGKLVTKFKIGDQVYGCAGGVPGLNGALADFIATDPQLLALKPSSLSLRQAAALPLVAITAWEARVTKANISAADHILIHGGTGGVGHIAIQIAKSFGATVSTTVANNSKADIARQLGADHTILYQDSLDKGRSVENYVDSLTAGKGFDIVFDASGGSDITKSFQAAKLNGKVVTIVSRYSADLTLMHQKGLSLHVVFMLIPLLHNLDRARHATILNSIANLVDSGKLHPLIDERRFSLDTISEAHRYLESRQSIGKIVVDIASTI